ncbi:hypothetical protein ACGFYQ_40205 [Streptomyces sp. NPDC048258]|uniref:hypothetical protein n=1 Tax=Streptomyces sp. NPDC048258 TaxID=3365527 RepID=UPI00371853B5
MADARRTARRVPVGSLFRPTALGPRLLTETLAVVARSARRRRGAGIAAICVTASEHRSCSGGEGGSGSGVTGGPRRRDTSAGAVGRRERAHEAVSSRTTSPHDLASLLAMLDLGSGPDGKRVRPKDDGGHPGRCNT